MPLHFLLDVLELLFLMHTDPLPPLLHGCLQRSLVQGEDTILFVTPQGPDALYPRLQDVVLMETESVKKP